MVLKLSLVPTLTQQPTSSATDAATAYRDIALEIDEMKALLALAREELLAVVSIDRQAQLEAGDATTSIRIATTDDAEVLVVHAERYKGLPMENVAALKEAFGPSYELYCDEAEAVSLKRGVTMDSLRDALGETACAELEKRLVVKHTVVPRKGTVAHLAHLYAADNIVAADNLATFVGACISAPAVRYK